eukprot:6501451-Pyramimonas_sp.AAC.1
MHHGIIPDKVSYQARRPNLEGVNAKVQCRPLGITAGTIQMRSPDSLAEPTPADYETHATGVPIGEPNGTTDIG